MFKKIAGKVVAFSAVAVASVAPAMAAVSTEVSTAISDGTADGKTIALGVLALIITVGIIKHVRRGV